MGEAERLSAEPTNTAVAKIFSLSACEVSNLSWSARSHLFYPCWSGAAIGRVVDEGLIGSVVSVL